MKSRKERSLAVLTCCLLAVLIPASMWLLFDITGQVSAADPSQDIGDIQIGVFVSNSSSKYIDKFKTALEIDPIFNVTYFTRENISAFTLHDPASLDQAFDVFCILDLTGDYGMTSNQAQNITHAVGNGTVGLFFQTNNENQPYNVSLLNILLPVLPLHPGINSSGHVLELQKSATDTISTVVVGASHPLVDKVGLISLPQLLNLTRCTATPSAALLVNASLGLTVGSQQHPLIASLEDPSAPDARVIELVAPVRVKSNKQLGNWPFWTYFIHVSILHLAGKPGSSIPVFADWAYSPIPQDQNKAFVMLLLVGFGCITAALFIYFKRYSRKTPLTLMPLDEFNQRSKARELKLQEKRSRLKKRENLPAEIQDAGTHIIDDAGSGKTWRTPGYHKPLSGFFTMFFITLVVVAPLFVVIIYVLPTFIIQDPSSFGIQFIISSIFSAVFITLDFGLAQAYDRFVGQYWSTEPQRALKYVQFFIWWQTLSGLAQTTIISLIGLYLVPRVVSVAFMSWFFVLNTLVQFPGIVYVFTHLLKSAQRTDLEALVNFLSLIFFQIGLMAVLPGIFQSIGAANPLIGEVIGSSIGLSIGGYAASMAQMLLSAAFLKKIDKRFSMKQMFRMDFDGALIKETLSFGLKSMLSNVIYLFGNFFSILIITLLLNNYTYYGSFIGIATYLTYPILFMTTLYENALPSTSEAYNNKKFKLTEVFISYGFKYFGMFALLLFTLFVLPFSVNQIVTSIVPDLFKPMGFVVMFYSVSRIFVALGDYSKLFLISIDRAGTYVVAVTIEQVIRISFLLLTIQQLQFFAFVFGEIPGVVVKVILTWVLTHKRVIKVRINWWQTVIAPGISCGIVALLAWFLNVLFFNMAIVAFTPVGGATIFMVIYFFGFGNFLYPFLLGFFGGHDEETLAQMAFAADKSGPSRPFALAFVAISRLGCRMSPKLHGMHAIPYEEAEKEASELLVASAKGE